MIDRQSSVDMAFKSCTYIVGVIEKIKIVIELFSPNLVLRLIKPHKPNANDVVYRA